MRRRPLNAQQVVDAAAGLADQDGLDAATLSALARGLGVRPPSLYKHVDSRPALLRLLAIRGYEQLAEAVTSAATGRSGPSAVRAAAHACRDYAHEHPGVYSATAPTTHLSDPSMVDAGERLMAVFESVLRAWVLDDDARVDAIRGLRAAVHGYVTLEQAEGFAAPRSVDASFDTLIDTLIAGLGPTTTRAAGG